MKNIGIFMTGTIAGALLVGLLGWSAMPEMMFERQSSKFGFDQTVAAIEESAKTAGWKIPKVYDIQESLHKAGHENMTRLKILSMCQPDHAFAILADDAHKDVAAMMPCRIGVYEDTDGKVFVTRLNAGLMSAVFGGEVETVMSSVATEQQSILKDIVDE